MFETRANAHYLRNCVNNTIYKPNKDYVNPKENTYKEGYIQKNINCKYDPDKAAECRQYVQSEEITWNFFIPFFLVLTKEEW